MSARIAVFASGGGTNLQSIIDHYAQPARGATVTLVVSDRAGAGALERAAAAGVPHVVIPAGSAAATENAERTLAALEDARIDIVALAGYLRLVPAAVVARYRGRIVNIHPALLPAFGGAGMYGKRVHAAVLAAGCTVSGATVHFVDEVYDRGAIIAQWPVPVLPGDDVDRLAARVLAVEHLLYPVTLDWLAVRVAAPGGAGRSDGPAAETAPTEAAQTFRLAAAPRPDAAGIASLIRAETD